MVPDTKYNFEDKEYWDKKVREFPAWGVGLESFEETNAVWHYFKYCLQTQNRFFFDHPLLPMIVKHFQEHIYILPKDTKIYRARIDHNREYESQCWLARNYIDLKNTEADSQFADYYKEEAAKIVANPEYQKFLTRQADGFEGFDAQGSSTPPYDKVPAGRCNPEHIVFLYASSDEHTATAEVRPYIRDAVSIATLSVEKDLKLVDFYYEYDEKGCRDIDNIFFDKMREEFSTLNKGNKEEYLTTQYLSLLAHHHGFDGIRFRSSLVEQGENYVIFDAKSCPPISSKMYVLKKVEYELLPIILPSEKELIK